MVTIIILSTMKFITCVKNKKKIFKSAQVFSFKEGTSRVQSLLNDDGIFFTAGFSNFSVVVTHVLANWLFNKLSYKKLRETLANKFLSCHKSLQYTYNETLKATEICIKNS